MKRFHYFKFSGRNRFNYIVAIFHWNIFYTIFKKQNWLCWFSDLTVQNLQSYILKIKYDDHFQFPVTQNLVSCNFHYPLH